MRKPVNCLCENKDADQLRGNREADQRLCFRYTDSTIPLLSKSEISSLYSSSVVVQPGLCGTWWKPRRPVFSERGSFDFRHMRLVDVVKICSALSEIYPEEKCQKQAAFSI